MKVQWQDSLEIGIIDIDIQHKLLFDKVNAFLTACETKAGLDEINRLFWFLEAYALTHFREEERLMQEIMYPDLVKHKERHLAFVKEVNVLKERLRQEGPTDTLTASAKLFISEWLYEHISKMDRALEEYVVLEQRRNAFS
ncbi:hemerythrin family protein [Geomonas sp. RF6]|uniref:hemerythrin family protein n=1 Tax=Geomonas sp. RF6 TaxID=2897342 RepID=UPI001E41B47C|nr:hemerythrin family protein [Geomonas sp. RF6]UFS70002.1 hemerythrin family protein [Geomonas sp. RF6]